MSYDKFCSEHYMIYNLHNVSCIHSKMSTNKRVRYSPMKKPYQGFWERDPLLLVFLWLHVLQYVFKQIPTEEEKKKKNFGLWRRPTIIKCMFWSSSNPMPMQIPTLKYKTQYLFAFEHQVAFQCTCPNHIYIYKSECMARLIIKNKHQKDMYYVPYWDWTICLN